MIVWLSDYTSNSLSAVEQRGAGRREAEGGGILLSSFALMNTLCIRRPSAHTTLQHITVYVVPSLLNGLRELF